MTHNTNDHDFERWLERNAPALNTPPATPRDEMWKEIQAALRETPSRRASRLGMTLHRPGAWAWPTALAAALVLGVVLDRAVISREALDTPVRASSPAAPRSAPVVASNEGANGPTTSGPAIASSEPATRSAARGGERRTTERAVASIGGAPATRRPDAGPLYRVAAQQTLGQAEALLTAYRANDLATTDPESARRLGGWARDVLTSTRLLLDSPAARDPQLDALLNDLELVLVQIVQLSGAPLQNEDRALIERAMREHDLLPRLRTAVPAGSAGAASDD